MFSWFTSLPEPSGIDQSQFDQSQLIQDQQPAPRPGGILMTPGTLKSRNKTVTFGAQVVDNENKKPLHVRSGIPNDCPGKFPSPWTPKTDTPAGAETRPRTRLTAALYEVRDSETKPKPARPAAKTYSKDDNDITLDVMEPRSESGRYWKDQYESYSQKSEKEVKKLVAKHHLAKDYAKKKDAEAIELINKLKEERKRHRMREEELQAQVKDHQEQLRNSMANMLEARAEIASLKQRVEALEGVGKTNTPPKRTSPTIRPRDQEEPFRRPSPRLLEEPVRRTSPRLIEEPVRRTSPRLVDEPVRRTSPRLQESSDYPSILIAESPTRSQSRAAPASASRLRTSRRHSSPAPAVQSRLHSTGVLQERKFNTGYKENIPPPDATPSLPSLVKLSSNEHDPWTADVSTFSNPTYDRMALPISAAPAPSSRTQTTTVSARLRRSTSSHQPRDILATALPGAAMRQANMEKRVMNDDKRSAARERLSQRRAAR